ncbi:unnamed protein product [Hymenolepis diminuta]|uniref:Ubiquitin-like-conjugating enzyme ATG10 n=1 Tax=Hymenolepis diminuta TaxID=6216 RepID=A0A0R3SDV7_HYMDI|nr:unnamed protein product [Hymenolepis diminuta]VUZ53916.1 unnamed protein product [Hymenolepis diminuta]
MESGLICSSDFNSALKKIYDVIVALHPEDIWKIETPDGSPNLELICNHFCTISNNAARLEYRITYNDAYSVPILMFRGSLKDGEPVPISYFWDCFSNRSSNDADPFSVISQMEHRQTGVPYFFVHPCKTKDLMSDVNPTSPKNYLSLWLSLMARYFDVFVPISIAKE